jgi:uracil-DNA glycosylase family 4
MTCTDDTPEVLAGPSLDWLVMASRHERLVALQREHRGCTRCVIAGHIAMANPVFSGRADQEILLVGQAPGPVEQDQTRPFAGRAGRQLMRWLQRAGFRDEDDVRARIYMTSMTTCFPGRAPGGGDRRPSAAEVALCRPWLDSALELLQPRLILPVGGLAISRFLPGRRLDDVIGHAFGPDGHRLDDTQTGQAILVPLPHPSGQSRWNNDPARAALRDRALDLLRGLSKSPE